jgi:hypothetical protein
MAQPAVHPYKTRYNKSKHATLKPGTELSNKLYSNFVTINYTAVKADTRNNAAKRA